MYNTRHHPQELVTLIRGSLRTMKYFVSLGMEFVSQSSRFLSFEREILSLWRCSLWLLSWWPHARFELDQGCLAMLATIFLAYVRSFCILSRLCPCWVDRNFCTFIFPGYSVCTTLGFPGNVNYSLIGTGSCALLLCEGRTVHYFLEGRLWWIFFSDQNKPEQGIRVTMTSCSQQSKPDCSFSVLVQCSHSGVQVLQSATVWVDTDMTSVWSKLDI